MSNLYERIKDLLRQGRIMAIYQIAKEQKIPADQIQRLIDRAGQELKTNR